VANVLNNAGVAWWASAPGVRGYDGAQVFPDAGFGSGAGQRANGTDAIELVSTNASGLTVVSHNATSAQFQVNNASHDLVVGDIVLACDNRQQSIFQMTGPSSTNNTVVHNTGGGGPSPGNCSKGLGFADPINCTTNGQAYEYGPNAQVAKLRAARWYVGNNGRGGLSLYQQALRNTTGTPGVTAEEVAEGVTDLQFEFLPIDGAAYQPATAIADWSDVAAVRVTVTVRGGQGSINENVGTDGAALQRQFTHVVTLRNRLP
jgi:type IV pilus assembly protein PilW